jgi:four helix bundle protein
MGFKFEELRVWQMALDISKEIDELAFAFPKREEYVLSPQIRRAADSIALNIAEGSTGQSNAEFKRFLGISLRSAIEVIACLHLGKKRNIISDDNFVQFYDKITILIKSIQALRNTLK